MWVSQHDGLGSKMPWVQHTLPPKASKAGAREVGSSRACPGGVALYVVGWGGQVEPTHCPGIQNACKQRHAKLVWSRLACGA